MALLVLSIGFMQNIMDLLGDMLNLLNDLVALLVLDWTWEESVYVVARGSATSMGPKGWNPNPT